MQQIIIYYNNMYLTVMCHITVLDLNVEAVTVRRFTNKKNLFKIMHKHQALSTFSLNHYVFKPQSNNYIYIIVFQ